MDEVMVISHTASVHGLAAHTLLQSREASQRFGTPQTYLTPKQTRRHGRLKAAVAVTASQDTLSLLPCVHEHNIIASPCTPLTVDADDATVNAFPHLPQASEQQPGVLEVLTQQLAEQHIPLCLPSQPLTPAPFSDSSPHAAAGYYLLDRYLQDVPSTTPQALSTQEAKQPASCQGVQHDPVTLGAHPVVSQPMTSTHQQHVKSRRCEHAGLAPLMPACIAMAAAHSQHQSSFGGLVTHLTSAELCQSPHFACMQEVASRALNNHRCADRSCQSAEVLRLQSSKGQTWKGLALRQAFLGRALGHSDGEASVQDAAGGGGLLNGGAEDGGEGGGPSRGWGGAAGEDGDAEEDEDDEDEDQDDDEDHNDSSSEDSQSEFDWTSSSLSEPSSMQHVGDLPHNQRAASSADNSSNICSCSQRLHQFPQSKQQVGKPYLLGQQDHYFHQPSQAFFYCFDSSATDHPAVTRADVKAPCQQQILTSSTRYRTTCRHKFFWTSPDRKQQDHVARYKDLPIHKQKRSGGRAWKEIPNFAIRLGINVLGSCL